MAGEPREGRAVAVDARAERGGEVERRPGPERGQVGDDERDAGRRRRRASSRSVWRAVDADAADLVSSGKPPQQLALAAAEVDDARPGLRARARRAPRRASRPAAGSSGRSRCARPRPVAALHQRHPATARVVRARRGRTRRRRRAGAAPGGPAAPGRGALQASSPIRSPSSVPTGSEVERVRIAKSG